MFIRIFSADRESCRSSDKWRNILHFRWSKMIAPQFYTAVAHGLFAIYLFSIILTTLYCRIHRTIAVVTLSLLDINRLINDHIFIGMCILHTCFLHFPTRSLTDFEIQTSALIKILRNERISAINVKLYCFSSNCIVWIKILKIQLSVHPHSIAF